VSSCCAISVVLLVQPVAKAVKQVAAIRVLIEVSIF